MPIVLRSKAKLSRPKVQSSGTKFVALEITVTVFFLILPILGSWNQTVELSFHFSFNFSRLKSQMTDELIFHK